MLVTPTTHKYCRRSLKRHHCPTLTGKKAQYPYWFTYLVTGQRISGSGVDFTHSEALRDAALLSSKGRCRAVCARWKTGDADEVRAFSNLVRDARSRGFIPTVILHARALIVAESLLEQSKATAVVVLDVTEDCRRSAWCSQAERVVLYALRPEPFLKNEKRNSPEEEPLVPDDLLTENNSVQVVLTPRRPAEWHHWLRTPAVASWASAPLLHDISNVSYLFVLYRSFLAVRAGFGDWPVDCGKQ